MNLEEDPHFINPQLFQLPNRVNGEWELVNGDPVLGMAQLPTANFPSGDRAMATPNFINPQLFQLPNRVNGEWELVNGDPVLGMAQLPTANFPSGDRAMATPNFINPQLFQLPNWVNGEWELVNGDPVLGMAQLPTANFPSGDRAMATPNFTNPQLHHPPTPPTIPSLKSNMHLCTMRTICLVLFCGLATTVLSQWNFVGNTTPTWEEVIQQYTELAARHQQATLMPIGKDDGGQPIHLFVVHDGTNATPQGAREAGKNVLFIINGIHPGEPDGIDASLLLARSLLESDQLMGLTAKTTVCIIPVLNVSGALDRTENARPDQNGPVVHGRRGNALNIDLNRDLTKLDSRNTQALVQALRRWDPDLLIDTHVSNGADHRYVMELLTTQKDKLEAPLNRFLTNELIPELYAWMDRKGITMCPYFETIKEVPDSGITGFLDGPRYTTGYAALFGTLGIMAESHMLKPYAERVNATYQVMLACLGVLDRKGADLREARDLVKNESKDRIVRPIHWEMDTTVVERLAWKGFQATYVPSRLSGLSRLRYDTTAPVDLMIDRYDHFVPTVTVTRPRAYLIPQAWKEVILRLAMNGVPMERLAKDTVFQCEVYHITDLSTVTSPREGRYPHYDVTCELRSELVTARSGDLVVKLDGVADRYLIEVLEPQGDDSFFAWGFFDAILQQKEWISPYAFEDIAADLVAKDPELRGSLEEKRKQDPAFAADGDAQLMFVYRHSPYMEPAYRRYPVARIMR